MVRGVRVGDDELLADVVIGADGVNSLVAEKSGLVSRKDTSPYMLAIKEDLDPPPETIEERFNLSENEGCCYTGIGYPCDDVGGANSLYTNKDSISLALFGQIDMVAQGGVSLHSKYMQLKEHPFIFVVLSNTWQWRALPLGMVGRRKGSVYPGWNSNNAVITHRLRLPEAVALLKRL